MEHEVETEHVNRSIRNLPSLSMASIDFQCLPMLVRKTTFTGKRLNNAGKRLLLMQENKTAPVLGLCAVQYTQPRLFLL